MADVKWIKICTDIFDDEKMLLIESMPDADGIIVIWFKLLCMAGKQNNSGVFMLNDKIAYTDEMLATVFRRPLNTVRLALRTFETYGMVEIVDSVVTIPNWEKHQSLDKLETAKEKNRQRVAVYRERQKLLAAGGNDYSNVTVMNCNDVDKDIDKDIDKEEEKKEIKKRTTASVDTPKKKYGTYSHILLTETQYERLVAEFGEQYANACINGVDEYIQMKGAKYKDHNLVIRKAIREGWSCIPERKKEQVKTARDVAGDKAQEEWKEKELLLSNPRYAELDKRVRQLTLASVNGENVAEELLACKDEMSRLRNKILKREV